LLGASRHQVPRAFLFIGGSTVTGNTIGSDNSGDPGEGPGVMSSHGDNVIDDNGSNHGLLSSGGTQ
jgi:hypothetical protein